MKLEPAIRVSHPAATPCTARPSSRVGRFTLRAVPIKATPPFDHAKTGQRPTDGDCQFLGPVARQLDAVNSPQFHHHLGIHRSGAEQIHPGNGVAATTPALIQV